MKIALTTFGSLGDLHPYLALALGLRQRGHSPVIVTSEFYRSKVEAIGVEFRSARPDMPDEAVRKEEMKKIIDLKHGTEYIVREFVMKPLRDTYADILAATRDVDLLVSHPLTLATPMAAEFQRKPWVSTTLAPVGYFSAVDPPVFPRGGWTQHLRWLGPWPFRLLYRILRHMLDGWVGPWREFRRELGLKELPNPMMDGQHSPYGGFGLFSPVFAAKQTDWPANTEVTGFPFFDKDGTASLPEPLERFLQSGTPPVVFTLGSSAVSTAGDFYLQSARAAKHLRLRSVFLVGDEPENQALDLGPESIVVNYAPYTVLFPRVAAVVHQGGIGTTAQVMRAGKPMVVVPFAHDQPDNAARVKRMGIAQVIPRTRYAAETVSRELQKLFADSATTERARRVGERVRSENGVEKFVRGVEEIASRVLH